MKREANLSEISDGRLYGINDMVKADCLDCKGCSDCCSGMGDTITLDPLDVHRIKNGLDIDFAEMLSECVSLNVHEGLIIPSLKMENDKNKCVFLNDSERCDIHAHRPGICRLFPLGRYYEKGTHSYFLQIYECSNKNRTKIKVGKWMDTPDLKQYEKYVDEWHYFILDIQKKIFEIKDTLKIKDINMYILNTFYVMPFSDDRFYEQFYNRLNNAKLKCEC